MGNRFFLLVVATLVSGGAAVACGNSGNPASTTAGVGGTTPGSTSTRMGGNSAIDATMVAGASSAGGTGNIGGASGHAGGAVASTAAGGTGGSVSSFIVVSSATVGGNTSSQSSLAATGGLMGAGGASLPLPSTVVGPLAVDVLFMIDNSASMADKQGVLATSLPSLLGRLVQPTCLDSTGAAVGKTLLDGTCAQGTPQFKPVNDLHIGVVTSSLGDHGAGKLCTPGTATAFEDSSGNVLPEPPDVNDQGHLVGTLARGASALAADKAIIAGANVQLDTQGFLAWGSRSQVPSTSDLNSAQHAFADMVSATHEMGCGLEAQLESWFRFLVDPVPPIFPIVRDPTTLQTNRTGSDDALLAQRAAFLRPNSVLVVVMLSDENDCSLRDTDVGWVAADTSHSITTGSQMCDTNPNDHCCYSCTANPPSGCVSGCSNPAPVAPDDGPYQSNLRCWQQKRRFGYSFMYPISRYVVGLTKPELCPDQTFGDMDCDCTYASSLGAVCSPGSRRVPNPLFSNVAGLNNAGSYVQFSTQVLPRNNNANIFLVGILGVPWQDVGFADADGNLKYVPVTDPVWTSGSSTGYPTSAAPHGIWNLIYGDDDSLVVPGDIHMVESVEPRSGLPDPNASAAADPIAGHEFNTAYMDLEYACIFALPAAKACACDATSSNYASCKYQHPNDCCDLTYNVDGRQGPGGSFSKPLCQGNTQVAAKSYPALREIAVLRDYALGASYTSPPALGNSVVTSICPKDLSGDVSSVGYGYNPVMDAIVARLADRLPKN